MLLSPILHLRTCRARAQVALIIENFVEEHGVVAVPFQIVYGVLSLVTNRRWVTVVDEEVDGVVLGAREAVSCDLAHWPGGSRTAPVSLSTKKFVQCRSQTVRSISAALNTLGTT